MHPRYASIGDYGAIGDCRSLGLISRAGSLDWLCWPRFDSAAIFCALLDKDGGNLGGRTGILDAAQYDGGGIRGLPAAATRLSAGRHLDRIDGAYGDIRILRRCGGHSPRRLFAAQGDCRKRSGAGYRFGSGSLADRHYLGSRRESRFGASAGPHILPGAYRLRYHDGPLGLGLVGRCAPRAIAGSRYRSRKEERRGSQRKTLLGARNRAGSDNCTDGVIAPVGIDSVGVNCEVCCGVEVQLRRAMKPAPGLNASSLLTGF